MEKWGYGVIISRGGLLFDKYVVHYTSVDSPLPSLLSLLRKGWGKKVINILPSKCHTNVRWQFKVHL